MVAGTRPAATLGRGGLAMPEPEDLPIALRAYFERRGTAERSSEKHGGTYVRPRYLFVFDTETTIDAAQGLTFGSWRVSKLRPGAGGYAPEDWGLIEHGLFHADDLPERDLATLRAYRQAHW